MILSPLSTATITLSRSILVIRDRTILDQWVHENSSSTSYSIAAIRKASNFLHVQPAAMIRHQNLIALNEPIFLKFLDELESFNYPVPFCIGIQRLILPDKSEIHITNQLNTIILYFYKSSIKNKRFSNADLKTQYVALYYQSSFYTGSTKVLYAADEFKKSAFETTKEDFFDVIMRQSEHMAEWFLFNPIL